MSLWAKSFNSKSKVTPIGGFAVKVVNNTGGVSVKGYIIEPSGTIDNAVKYTADGDPDPCGIILDPGVAEGDEMWIVISGIAEVYYGVAVTRGTFSRVPVSADGLLTGQAMNEPLPTSPFATDKHFQEIGHPIETTVAPGLAKTFLHFN